MLIRRSTIQKFNILMTFCRHFDSSVSNERSLFCSIFLVAPMADDSMAALAGFGNVAKSEKRDADGKPFAKRVPDRVVTSRRDMRIGLIYA